MTKSKTTRTTRTTRDELPRGGEPIAGELLTTAPFVEFETPEGRTAYVVPDAVLACVTGDDDTAAAPDADPATTTLYLAGGVTLRVLGDIDSIMGELAGTPPALTMRSEAARISPPAGDQG